MKGPFCILAGLAAAVYAIWSLASHQTITISRGSALTARNLEGGEAVLYNILFLGLGVAGIVVGIRFAKGVG